MSPKGLLAIQDCAKKRLLSVREAAMYLGLSSRTLYNGIAPGSKNPFPVKPRHYGKRRLFEKEHLDAFCDSLPREV
jgi:excisionase family DNA binding protein